MYFFILAIQMIGLIVPVAGLFAMMFKEQNKTSMYLLLTDIGCLIMNAGYILVLVSKEQSAARMALNMEYLGNIMFYFFCALFIMSYLRIQMKKWWWLLGLWLVQDMLALMFLWSGYRSDLVYASIHYKMSYGLMFPQMMFGSLHVARYGLVNAFLTGLMIYTTYRMFRTEKGKRRNNLAKLSGAQFVIVVSLSTVVIIKFAYDISPLFSALAIMSIIIGVLQGGFFSVTDQGKAWLAEHMDNAFIITDRRYGYQDANACAKKLFPELRNLLQSEPLPKELETIIRQDSSQVQMKEEFFERTLTVLGQDEADTGYGILLTNVTAERRMLKELEEAKLAAEEANEAKSAFMSNMSHEIRTPMNAIVGMTEILLREELPEHDREYLNSIRSSGDALLSIINDILDFSKIEAGKMEIVEEEYEPMSLFHDLSLLFLNRIGDKPVELLYDIDPEMPAKLYGDSKRIRQVIINIMNNAIKFTEEGSVTLEVKVKKDERNKLTMSVVVKDTGQGIREEDLGKLFGSFAQVDTKKNHNKEGTGLGLSICKQLVGLMGGEIGVTSVYGEGSCFYFTLPQRIVDTRRAAEISEMHIEKPVVEESFRAPKAKILIVDDTEMNLKVAIGLLAPLQMQIETAADGKEAMEKILGNHYDLVFMDHMMPVMDGVEATKAIRDRGEGYFQSLPIIALSANATTEAQKMFAENGFSGFVAKPIRMKELCQCLQKWLPKDKIDRDSNGSHEIKARGISVEIIEAR